MTNKVIQKQNLAFKQYSAIFANYYTDTAKNLFITKRKKVISLLKNAACEKSVYPVFLLGTTAKCNEKTYINNQNYERLNIITYITKHASHHFFVKNIKKDIELIMRSSEEAPKPDSVKSDFVIEYEEALNEYDRTQILPLNETMDINPFDIENDEMEETLSFLSKITCKYANTLKFEQVFITMFNRFNNQNFAEINAFEANPFEVLFKLISKNAKLKTHSKLLYQTNNLKKCEVKLELEYWHDKMVFEEIKLTKLILPQKIVGNFINV